MGRISRLSMTLALLMLFATSSFLVAQDQPRVRERIRDQTLNRFDENGDGKLSVTEREQAQAFLRERSPGKRDPERDDSNAQVDPEQSSLYKLKAGSWLVARKNLNLERGPDKKPLSIAVTFPVADLAADPTDTGNAVEALPVIVFSHGAGGSRDTYRPLIEHWVSHGYVCLQPTHGDSLSLLNDTERKQVRLRNYVSEGGITKYLIPRTEDVKLLLDQLPEIQNAVPEMKFRLDDKRIGLGGHSFGAYTTQLVGGLTLINPQTRLRSDFSDPRPLALLMISPQGLGGPIDRESFTAIQRPTMVMTGSQDDGLTGEPASWRLGAFSELPTETKYLMFVEGAHHNFGGISGVQYLGAGESNPDHVYYVKSSSLAFWDSQLKSDTVATEYLDSQQLQQATRWLARISRTVQVESTVPRN